MDPAEEESSDGAIAISFNHDASCVSIGTRAGFYIYNLTPTLEQRLMSEGEGMRIVEMLYVTSLLAVVGSGDSPNSNPRLLQLWNSQSRTTIYKNAFPSAVLSVRMNLERLVVCCETQIHIFELALMSCIHVLSTTSNPAGLVALSDKDTQFLAFPHGTPGTIVIYDCLAPNILQKLVAHKSAVVEMQFSRSGTRLATASNTGTVIRVFDVPSGTKLYSFRRGNRPAIITSISFSPSMDLIAVGSSSGTVHIFSFEAYDKRSLPPAVDGADASSTGGPAARAVSRDSGAGAEGKEAPGWKETIRSTSVSAFGFVQNWAFTTVGSLNVLPEDMQEFSDSVRASSLARIPGAEGNYKIAIIAVPGETEGELINKLVVFTRKGSYYKFSIPEAVIPVPVEPALCTLEDEAVLSCCYRHVG